MRSEWNRSSHSRGARRGRNGATRVAEDAGEPGPCPENGGAPPTTAGIAHEIKNLLNFVNNFAGLSVELLEELRERRRRQSVHSIPASARRSSRRSGC